MFQFPSLQKYHARDMHVKPEEAPREICFFKEGLIHGPTDYCSGHSPSTVQEAARQRVRTIFNWHFRTI